MSQSIWYEVGKYENKVIPTVVLRETEHQLTVSEVNNYTQRTSTRRRYKHTEYNDFFPTELEAWEYLKKRNEQVLDVSRKNQLGAECNLDEIHKNLERLTKNP